MTREADCSGQKDNTALELGNQRRNTAERERVGGICAWSIKIKES